MPESTPEKVQNDTIESPYRISWRRLLKVILPIFVLFLIIAFWFVGVYTPSKIEAPPTVPTPDFQEATPSAKPATSSAQKDETAGWKTYLTTNVAFSKVSYSIKYPPTLNEGSLYEEPFAYTKTFSNYKETEGYGATACEGEGKGDNCFTITLSIQDKDGPEESTRDYNFVNSMSVGTTKTDDPKLGDIKYTKHNNVSYGSNNWLTYTAQRDPKLGTKYLYGFMLKKDGVVYYLNLSSDNISTIDKNKDLLEKILSTFRFD